MSVYTTINKQELKVFLSQYNLGELTSFEGISAGIENTNYFVNTSQGRFVLTIFEHHNIDELDYFLQIMAFMAKHNIPTAHPETTQKGEYLTILKDKPVALVARLEGGGVEMPSLKQVMIMGENLAKFHLAGDEFELHRDNDRGLAWMQATFTQLSSRLPTDEKALIAKELNYQTKINWQELPQGVIHADLFCDNALFNGDKLSGIIDLYYACNSILIYDLAVMVNDWCRIPVAGKSELEFKFDNEKMSQMLNAYQQVRKLTTAEQKTWQSALRLAALRFFLSRLKDKYSPRGGEMIQIKNPQVYKKILQIHQR